jgi:hypothetical protein
MRRHLVFFFMATLATLDSTQAQTMPEDYQLVTSACQPQRHRFPPRYAKYKQLRSARKGDREHLATLAVKNSAAHINLAGC